MPSFTKLFNTIVTSTVWQEPHTTRIVWITMLAIKERDGSIYSSIPGLARLAGVTIEECERALDTFKKPDPYSRTKEHDGRRIEEIDGGWIILNASKYRELMSVEERREYNRLAKQRERRRKAEEGQKDVNKGDDDIDNSAKSAHSDSDSDSDSESDSSLKEKNSKKRIFIKPTVEEIQKYCESRKNHVDAESFYDFYESKGWVVGKSPMKDWKAAVRTWERGSSSKKEGKGQHGKHGGFNKNIDAEQYDKEQGF